jgi:hypothetical protein
MSYSFLKLIHLISVMLFLGNIMTGLYWMYIAIKTKYLIQMQRKLYNLTLTSPDDTNEFDWSRFNKVYKEWDIWGLIATLTPLAAFVMMVLKHPV